jgi:hypothetical protein
MKNTIVRPDPTTPAVIENMAIGEFLPIVINGKPSAELFRLQDDMWIVNRPDGQMYWGIIKQQGPQEFLAQDQMGREHFLPSFDRAMYRLMSIAGDWSEWTAYAKTLCK